MIHTRLPTGAAGLLDEKFSPSERSGAERNDKLNALYISAESIIIAIKAKHPREESVFSYLARFLPSYPGRATGRRRRETREASTYKRIRDTFSNAAQPGIRK